MHPRNFLYFYSTISLLIFSTGNEIYTYPKDKTLHILLYPILNQISQLTILSKLRKSKFISPSKE